MEAVLRVVFYDGAIYCEALLADGVGYFSRYL